MENEFVSFANQIGIATQGTMSDGKYIVHLEDSDVYSKAYTLLSNSKILHLDSDEVTITEHNSTMKYLSDDFDVVLDADFDNDDYNITIEKAD
jgi:hypothetical protein